MDYNHLALLWDMDGTIINSKISHFITFKETLEKHGYTLDRDVFDANFGRNNQTILPLFLGFDPNPALMESIIQEKEEAFRQIAPKKSTLIPGVKTWIESAKSMHIPQAVTSSAGIENIKTLLSSFKLLSYFEAIFPGDDLPAKPEPDLFLKAAAALNKVAEHCLVIEDSPAGVKAARNAGMLSIAVTTTFSHSELSHAELVLPDFTTPLKDVLRNLDFLQT